MAGRNNQTVDTTAKGPFHPNPPREVARYDQQHQIGTKASANDRAPEFHVQTLTPGTAPASSSYQPNVYNQAPGQANNDSVFRSHGKESVYTHPLNTYPGATSGDVDKGYGKPMHGKTSNELRHSGEHKRKHHGSGYEGVGATGRPHHGGNHSIGDTQKVDPRRNPDQRALDREEAVRGEHGNKGEAAAEDIQPQSADNISAEQKSQNVKRR